MNTPSFSDIFRTDYTDESTPLLLAHGLGMMVYRKPFLIDQKTGKNQDQEARDVMLEYCEKQGIDILGFSDGDFKKFHDMNKEERTMFTRQFIENTGVIVEEALWDNIEGIEKIMEYINLKK